MNTNKNKWVKTSSYGDYTDINQNHKNLDKNEKQHVYIKLAKSFGIKHPGSKSIRQLKQYSKYYSKLQKSLREYKNKV